MTPYMTMMKLLTSLILYCTKCRHKRRAHSNNTSSDFALEVSFSIYINFTHSDSINVILLYQFLGIVFTTNSHSSVSQVVFHQVNIEYSMDFRVMIVYNNTDTHTEHMVEHYINHLGQARDEDDFDRCTW